MNTEIMELFIDFPSVVKDGCTKLWCGEMGKEGPHDADHVCTSETGKRSGNRVSSSSKGKRLSLILENF